MMDPFQPKERAHLKALWDAYFETSGAPLLTPSPDRIRALRELDKRGLTAADVRGVIGVIKRAIAKGVSGYTENSLDWRNVMKSTDRFEELAHKLRQAEARRAGAKREAAAKAPRAQSHALPDGSRLNVLESQPAATEVPKVDVKKALRDLANEIGGK